MKKDNFLAGQKLLIAEDDDNSYLLLEYILNQVGAEIMRTETGEDTIQALLKNPDVCLILMDIKMAGMNGLYATRKIREFNVNVPIIVQTAIMFKDDKSKILEAGCNDFISKPIDKELLLQKIDQLLSQG